jgi:glycosyltransferase involved in cell wall biosynthesis
MAARPKILVICDFYLPGYESGGSMRTLVNMIDRFGERFDFRVITRDHDGKKNREPYTTVQINDWNEVGGSNVYYLSKDKINPGNLKRLILETAPAAIYVNSFFSPLTIYTLILRKLKKIPYLPVILAPEGELSAGSLMLKKHKKILYMRTAKLLNLKHDVIWKVASEVEQEEVERFGGKMEKLFIAPNMPPKMILPDYDQSGKFEKQVGSARFVFLSRFMRTKNFNWLVDRIRSMTGNISIDVYGPLQEPDYWEECEKLIATLPSNIKIEAKGPVPNAEVALTMSKYHFFILPTLGENFGHVFIEALASGCPLIISDRTPWLGLEKKGIGWDLPLESPQHWRDVIEKCIEMPPEEYEGFSRRAREFALDWLHEPSVEESNLRVLEFGLNGNARPHI